MKVYKHGICDYITVVEIPKKEIKRLDLKSMGLDAFITTE